MHERLVAVTEVVAVVIEAVAVVVIALGTAEAFLGGVRVAFRPVDARWRRETWMRYARWLVAGLTFQLAADIVKTSIAPSWDEIGRLGAIAVIRTFLNFFLEHDIAEARAGAGESGA